MLKSRTDSGSLQNGLEAAAFCYTSAHDTPLLFNMLWLEHLTHGDGYLPPWLMLHSKDFVGPEKQRKNRAHKSRNPS